MRQIEHEASEWLARRENNAIAPGIDLPAFGQPLFGWTSGADPLFSWLKYDIGSEFYWTPLDAYRIAFPDDAAVDGDISVLAWILPQTAHTRAAHRKCRDRPSIEWSRARHFGEKLNENLRRFLVETLVKRGIRAVAPVLLPQWGRALSPRYGFASSWSERHAAYACGLGTFGLSDGLITPAGKAVRVGSLVARIASPPAKRPYTAHNQWCLMAAKGACGACIRRCPAGAVSEAGHDKVKCKEFIRGVTARFVEQEQLGFRVNSCGLCQTGVPCEAANPMARRGRKLHAAGM